MPGLLGGLQTGKMPCAPITEITAKVETKHVDSGTTSHFMVTTSAGTFEVDNNW